MSYLLGSQETTNKNPHLCHATLPEKSLLQDTLTWARAGQCHVTLLPRLPFLYPDPPLGKPGLSSLKPEVNS